MSKIVVLGSCSVDYATYAPRLPRPGETLHGTKFTTSYGGKGANQAVAAAKLSAQVSMIGKVGDDVWGQRYIDNMAGHGVDVSNVSICSGSQTGIAQIVVGGETGENQIVIVRGANEYLSARDVEKARDLIEGAAVLVCQLETPVEASLKAFQLCKGMKILNAAPALENLNKELLSLTTLLCVNESEASLLSGKAVNTVKDAAKVLKDLLLIGCEIVIITLGGKGAIYATESDQTAIHVPSPNVAAVDTTGAGDAFIGALAAIVGSEPKADLNAAVRAACLAASESVTAEGTQESFPRTPYGELLERSRLKRSM